MEKQVEYRVLVSVNDRGEFDAAYPRDAIIEGIERAVNEGNFTALGDESTTIIGWTVSHVSTRELS